jgi:hypothetical protein
MIIEVLAQLLTMVKEGQYISDLCQWGDSKMEELVFIHGLMK